jgi:hypothetical protein
VSGSGGSYTVTGSHRYHDPGPYPISVAIKDIGGSTVTVTGTATINQR